MRTSLLLILSTLTLLLSAIFKVEGRVAEPLVQQGISIDKQQADYLFECNWSSIYAENLLSRPTLSGSLFARRIAPTTTAETLSAMSLSHKDQPQHNFTISRARSMAYAIKYDCHYYQYTLCCIRI